MPTLDTSTRILNATRALFEREGADAVSMRKVAEAVPIESIGRITTVRPRPAKPKAPPAAASQPVAR